MTTASCHVASHLNPPLYPAQPYFPPSLPLQETRDKPLELVSDNLITFRVLGKEQV